MADKIRVNSGTKCIEVNDQGECILLPLGDNSFVCGFYKLVDGFRQQMEAVKLSEEDILGGMEQVNSLSAAFKGEVDALFGEDTCRKVFGDITPGIDMFMDFFDQLLPFFEEHSKSRVQRLSKYSAGRTGSV